MCRSSFGHNCIIEKRDSRITPFGAVLRHYKLDELPGLWDVLIGNMSFVGPRPDVPGYADKLTGDDRDVLKLRPGITGPATLKYRLEDEMISDYVAKRQAEGDTRPMQEIATEYNDKVIYPIRCESTATTIATTVSGRTSR